MTMLSRSLPFVAIVLLVLPAAACSGKTSSSNPPPFAATTPIADSDIAVAANVMAALAADVVLRGSSIDAVVRKGDVRLTGVVPDSTQRARAETIARAVQGVHTIHNELTMPATS